MDKYWICSFDLSFLSTLTKSISSSFICIYFYLLLLLSYRLHNENRSFVPTTDPTGGNSSHLQIEGYFKSIKDIISLCSDSPNEVSYYKYIIFLLSWCKYIITISPSWTPFSSWNCGSRGGCKRDSICHWRWVEVAVDWKWLP